MSCCDDCIHYDVCGDEDARDPAMICCDTKISKFDLRRMP